MSKRFGRNAQDDDDDFDWKDLPPHLPKRNGRPMVDGYTQDEPIPHDEVKAIRIEAIGNLLRWLDQSGKAAQVGRRVLIVGYLLGQSECTTQKALSSRLGLRSGETSAMVRLVKRYLGRIADEA